MSYDELIETISIMVEESKINKIGLTMTYSLDEANHRTINEILFYKSNPTTDTFIASDEFEVVLGGILVKFVKRL